jgi:hypothetical protein
MARVLLGPMVSDARGKQGGTVFSRNAAGAYTRAKVSPKQPRSILQRKIRNAVAACAVYWRDTATPAIRLAWETYAKTCPLGDVFGARGNRSGLAMFIRSNAISLSLGGPMRPVAPVLSGEAQIPALTLTGTVALGVRITAVSPALVGGDMVFLLRCVAPVSQARNYYSTPFHHTGDGYIDISTVYPFVIIPPAECAVGQRWFIRARLQLGDNRMSTPATFRVDILA